MKIAPSCTSALVDLSTGRMFTWRQLRKRQMAFTLLEVMIAVSLFFMCVFAILGVVSRSLNQARNLTPFQVDANSALAELALTNRLEEGTLPIEIIQHFEEIHPGYTVEGTITEVATNGLFQVDLMVGGLTGSRKIVQSTTSAILWRPYSRPRGVGPGRGIR
ncbi:MAG: type II secretion system protein [Verrucomicrobiales bacterium]